MFISDELKRRNVPSVMKFANGNDVLPSEWEIRRRELVEILAREEYGYMPPPAPVSYEIIQHDDGICAGKARYSKLALNIATPNGTFSFPLHAAIPNNGKKCPLILHISFEDLMYQKYMPTEEIIDNGFAVAMIYYKSVTDDKDDNFESGIAAFYDRKMYNWGKIGMWAWAAMRALDYLCGLDDIDAANIAVAGHSRLGKTALWCGANDTRVKFTISNNSGCSGAAITRDKVGETVEPIVRRFPHWFCQRYRTYANNESAMPFDQNYLIAACAPRYVLVGTAAEDTWADPFSEYLAVHAASDAYKAIGLKGIIGEDRKPEVGDIFHEGEIGFHMREGKHFFSRYDWNMYMNYIKARL